MEGFESFVIPDDVGGRYSVLTAVGLLPIAVAGLNIDVMVKGAQAAREDFSKSELSENIAYQYAAVRNVFIKIYNHRRRSDFSRTSLLLLRLNEESYGLLWSDGNPTESLLYPQS